MSVAKSRGVIGRNVRVGVGPWGVEGLHPEISSMRIKARKRFFICIHEVLYRYYRTFFISPIFLILRDELFSGSIQNKSHAMYKLDIIDDIGCIKMVTFFMMDRFRDHA